MDPIVVRSSHNQRYEPPTWLVERLLSYTLYLIDLQPQPQLPQLEGQELLKMYPQNDVLKPLFY